MLCRDNISTAWLHVDVVQDKATFSGMKPQEQTYVHKPLPLLSHKIILVSQ